MRSEQRNPTIAEEFRIGAKYMYGLARDVGQVTGIVEVVDGEFVRIDPHNLKELLVALAIVTTLAITQPSLDGTPLTNKVKN